MPNEDTEKEVEFYSQSVNAWFNTRLEHDKSLLYLSSGAIGLLLTLLVTRGIASNIILILYIISLACFIICLIAVLVIFQRNATHLEDVINGKDSEDNTLTILDRVSASSFLLGIFMASIIGLSVAITPFTKEKAEMSNKTVSRCRFQDSFNNVAKLRPSSDDLGRSFNGVSNLKPTTTINQTANQGNTGQSTSSNTGGNNKK